MIYFIGTAIGNIKDTSYRAVETLIKSDIILAEDSRTFNNYYIKIQNLFNLKSKKKQIIIPYYIRNELDLLIKIKAYNDQKLDISLVTESGMPLISDPGQLLSRFLIKKGIAYSVIPGPTAFTTALLLSGFKFESILFIGFMPKKRSDIERIIRNIISNKSQSQKPLLVFYESPNRINKTISILKTIVPNADIAICRELTKKFEETIRSKISMLPQNYIYKGEVTVIMQI